MLPHPMVDSRAYRATSAMSLRVTRLDNQAAALGFTVNYMRTLPAFATLPFGEWSSVLAGQIVRSHYWFAVDGNNDLHGFLGWALITKEKAEEWIVGGVAPSSEECKHGDCLLINAYAANGPKAHRFLWDETRKLMKDKRILYFRRHYKDG